MRLLLSIFTLLLSFANAHESDNGHFLTLLHTQDLFIIVVALTALFLLKKKEA